MTCALDLIHCYTMKKHRVDEQKTSLIYNITAASPAILQLVLVHIICSKNINQIFNKSRSFNGQVNTAHFLVVAKLVICYQNSNKKKILLMK